MKRAVRAARAARVWFSLLKEKAVFQNKRRKLLFGREEESFSLKGEEGKSFSFEGEDESFFSRREE